MPEIPSKYDIIPIHTSDRGTYKSCRRRWAWSSPSQRNLVPRIAAHGVRLPLWFGTGYHHALEHYYSHRVEDPVTAFEAWYNLEWNGGLVHESELDRYGDRDPVPGPNPGTYWVKGLSELLPDPDPEVFETHRELGIGMLTYYKDYAERNDNFRVIQTEHLFSVPILDEKGKPLYAVDTRVMPEDWEPDFTLENAYGPLILGDQTKQVHARGRMDIIVQDLDNGSYGIRDYKTTSSLDDDYFRHLDLDEQCTTYLWASEIEANLYDYEYKSVDWIHYVACKKAYPKPPTMTTKGLPSIDRQKESTTAEMFERCIRENNLEIVFNSNEKMQQYFTYLLEMGEKQFIWVEPVRRNKAQKKNMGLRIYYEAREMLSQPVLYPNPRKEYSCLNCIFRAPCIAAEDGSDWESMLEGNYVTNYDR